jgi:hypothetical protein
MLAIVTARLERLYQAHWEKAYRGNPAASHIVLKCCAHLSALHGLYQPAVSAINNVNNTMLIDATPRQTSTDRIEAALNALIEDGKRTAAAKAANRKEPAGDAQVVEPEPADVESSDA